MKAGLLFAVAAVVLGSCSNRTTETSDTASGTAMGSRYTKFSSWCTALPLLQRSTNVEDLASAKTVLALMTRAKQATGNFSISCTEADNFLSTDKVIFLARQGLTSVRPLAVFTNADSFFLENNDITDLSPLKNLTNLRFVNVKNNSKELQCPFVDTSICGF